LKRSTDRILTTHVGSLIRPADLLQQSKAAKQSPQELARYEHTLRCATVNVVEQQINAGIDIVNDGEFGKPRWSKYVLDRLTGFELRTDSTFEQSGSVATGFASDNSRRASFPRGATSVPGHVCVAPIALCSSRSWLVART
jgi:5-methyltetrahydropteroyltriglutamate--homocysteine methyltransferase